MGPVVLARESGKETGGGNTAGGTSADICKIGEVAFQLFLIIVPERQPPYAVPRLRPRCLQLAGQIVFVREPPRAAVTPLHLAPPPQRCYIHPPPRLQTLP